MNTLYFDNPIPGIGLLDPISLVIMKGSIDPIVGIDTSTMPLTWITRELE